MHTSRRGTQTSGRKIESGNQHNRIDSHRHLDLVHTEENYDNGVGSALDGWSADIYFLA